MKHNIPHIGIEGLGIDLLYTNSANWAKITTVLINLFDIYLQKFNSQFDINLKAIFLSSVYGTLLYNKINSLL